MEFSARHAVSGGVFSKRRGACMTGGVVFMLPRSFPALRATERDSGVVNIIANEISRVFDGAIGTIRADDGNGHRSEE